MAKATLGVHLWGPDPESLRTKAAAAESLGFASITVGDHLGYLAPLTACAVIADATEHVQLGPLVLNNDLRHPVVLAQEAAALADLSGGRFELGLGSGFARREYERAGLPFASREVRAQRLGEAAQILRALLAGETVSLDGDHYSVSGHTLGGPPRRVPILIGGNSAAVQEVAVEHADIVGLIGFSPKKGGAAIDASHMGASALDDQVARLRELAAHHASDIELQALVQWHEVTGDRRRAAERAAAALEIPVDVALDSTFVLLGTPAEIATQLLEHRDRFGITRWTIFGDRPELAPAEALAPILERLA